MEKVKDKFMTIRYSFDKIFLLSIICLIIPHLTIAQSEVVLVVNSTDELKTELSNIVEKDKVRKLFVLVPQNHADGWKVLPPASAKVNYEKASNSHAINIERTPEVLGKFTSLEELDLSNIGLKTLDNSILNLSKLRILNISENNIILEEQLRVLEQLNNLQTIVAFDCGVSEKAINKLQRKKRRIEVLYSISDYAHLSETYFSWRQQYLPLTNKEETLFQLLGSIHQYYPVGLSWYGDRYPGAREFRRIEAQWAEALKNGNQKTPWQKALEQLRIGNQELKLRNYTNLGYPSNRAVISLDSIETDNIIEVKNLYLVQSIFTNHFTVFIDSRVELKNYRETGNPIEERILYGEKNARHREGELISLLIRHMKSHFPSYTFVHHKLLMETMITGGIPRSADREHPKKQYPLYDFLFGGEIAFGDFLILE